MKDEMMAVGTSVGAQAPAAPGSPAAAPSAAGAAAAAPPAAAPLAAASPAEGKPYISVESDYLPTQRSTIAPEIDAAYWTVTWISIPFFFVVVGPMIYFAFKYKRKSEDERTSPVDHNLQIELIWTIVPAILLVYLFWIGIKGFANASVPPNDALEIQVTGQMFNWTFTYPDGTTTTELGVPRDRPVHLTMSSKDVIHSFFVPEFRVKQDVVPGLYTTLWFTATKDGETALECAEFCGDGHSKMLTKVYIMPSGPDDKKGTFESWVLNGGLTEPLPPVALGKKRYDSLCASCHSLDGSRIQGPSFKGVFGREESLSDGSKVLVDENYVRQSILAPQAQLVQGYPATMPVFSYLKDKDIEGIIAFLKEQK